MKQWNVQLLIAVVAVSLFVGCQTRPVPVKRTAAVMMPSAKKAAVAPEKIPVPLMQKAGGGSTTPPPSAREGVRSQAGRGEKYFDVAVNNQDVREFFYGLMQTTGKNIVVHPDVAGRVSLSLQHVTLQEVLTALNDIYGYDYQHNGYGYVILPTTLNTRVFAINYLNVQRKGFSSTSVSSGEMTSVDSTESRNNSSNRADTSTSSSTKSDVANSTAIETNSNSDFWAELKSMLSMMVDTSKGGVVVINPQASLVVVRGLPHELRSVDNFLFRTQLSLNRQVVLEAKILEVVLSTDFQAGINWSALGDLTHNGDSTIKGALSSLPLASKKEALGGVFGVTIASQDFNVVIELLKTQGDVSVLSSPRVATVNNQTAAIKVGTESFFVTDVKNNTTTTGLVATQSPDVTLTPFFSGIVLNVTPQIDDAKNVILHVHPTVSEVKDEEKTVTLGTQVLTLPLASSTIREADSVVRAKSNQIVLIGGLMSNVSYTRKADVPWLADVPGLGWLFTQRREASLKSELVILLRPIITDAPEQGWASEDMREADRHFADGAWLPPAPQ